jgi:hypothetical protein
VADLPPFDFYCALNFATKHNQATFANQPVQGLVDSTTFLLSKPLQCQGG